MAAGVPRERLEAAYATSRRALLDEFRPTGHWEGELSTSALSTATAIMALEMVRRQGHDSFQGRSLAGLIANGLNWLAEHRNGDGGWGDTVKSNSNISTTMLCRAVFVATGQAAAFQAIVDAASGYIDRAGGVNAVVARYGRDRTFSVPILTQCALAGEVAWRDVMPLPFELACLPARFYRTVRLPVVSYALPALIAIGQVRHHFRPTWNPIARMLRALAKRPSLRVLERIQPTSGGFLEATPLTSFVTMSLATMQLADHPVTRRGVRFIIDSVRDDGSWPIDTNLSTWVTTLGVNALGDDLPEEHREPILHWLLNQQFTTRHRYTNADPGGWAWTDLPGGVPDADDTPGAMLSLLGLSGMSARKSGMLPSGQDGSEFTGQRSAMGRRKSADVAGALNRGVAWLLDLQNRDGGWPTFCRGWGRLPFDRSAPDLTAHVLRALIGWFEPAIGIFPGRGLKMGWRLPDRESWRPYQAIVRGFAYLEAAQRRDGSWLPLWFGNQHAENDINPTYGTARVLAAYRDWRQLELEPARRGLQWLARNQNEDGGWGGGAGIPSSTEETALAVEVLLQDPENPQAAARGLTWLVERVEDGSWREPAPIGFYFARLWYFERLYPLIFTTGALRQSCRRA